MERNEELPENINYNVYNGLNLMNEELGQSYVENGFNPLGDDFVLDEDYITEQLESNTMKEELNSPDFILEGDTAAMGAFQTSSENVQEMVDLLQGHLNNPDIPEPMKNQFRKMLAYLLSRNELIRLYKKKKKKERNALLMLQNLNSLNWELGRPLKDSYKKPFDTKKAMEEYSKIAEHRARRRMHRMRENDLLIERAREIMEKNNQERMHHHHERTEELTRTSLGKNANSKTIRDIDNGTSKAPATDITKTTTKTEKVADITKETKPNKTNEAENKNMTKTTETTHEAKERRAQQQPKQKQPHSTSNSRDMGMSR